MYRINYDLGKINETFNLGISVIYRDDNNQKKVSKVTWNGNTYLNFKLYPYFNFKFITPNEKEYNRNSSQILNRFDTFHFVMQGKEILNKFKERQELFSYENSKLVLNKKVANEISTVVNLKDGRKVLISPVVVNDKDTSAEFEGFVMFSNSYDTYATFTFDEFAYLVSIMDKMDIDSLAVQLLTYVESTKDDDFDVYKIPVKPTYTLEQTTQTDTNEKVSSIPLINNGTIPNI